MQVSKKQLLIFFIIFIVLALQATFLLSENSACAQSLWDKQIGKEELSTAYDQPDTQPRDIREIIVRIIKVFLSFMGLFFTILVIWAGYKWMTAAGNQDRVKEAKDQIAAGAIGIIIIITSVIITDFITYCVLDILEGDMFLCQPP